jgi:Cys-tRNA(Pro)/Cys-tRNA(Cys) deacylase
MGVKILGELTMTELHPRVEEVLTDSGVDYKVHRHADYAGTIRNAEDFSRALDYEISRITKTLFVRTQDRTEFAALVCSMDKRIDFKAAARALGHKRLETASRDDLEAQIGYPINGVSPLGLPPAIHVVIDESLRQYPTVLIGGGETAVEVEISPEDLARACNSETAPITK